MDRIRKYNQKEFTDTSYDNYGLVKYQHYKYKHFSEDGNKRVGLNSIESHRGGGRSIVIGGIPGLIGMSRGKKVADRADKEGKSDTQILKESSRAGAKTGALAGGIGGAIGGVGIPLITSAVTGGRVSAARLAKNAVSSGLVGAGLGSLGGYLGAKKNTRVRLEKRRSINDSLKD